jgi:hypothetical protein
MDVSARVTGAGLDFSATFPDVDFRRALLEDLAAGDFIQFSYPQKLTAQRCVPGTITHPPS